VPLAIALAAARANVSTPREILDSLAKRLDFSATAGEPVPDRHRTLRAAIEWSYDFLPPALQQFFANLGVFRGGFTAEAAAVVAAPDDLAGVSGSVKRALAELRTGSLITAFEAGECMRYRMLETLRCYAEEQLSASGSAAEVQARHGGYFCGLAMEAESRLQGADQPQALNSLELEQENLRAALDSPQPVELRLQMAVALATFWRVRGYAREAQGWIARLRAEAGDTPAAAGAANAEGILAWSAADLPAARAAFEITLQHFRESGDLRNVAGVLSNLAMVASASGDLQLAREHAEESVRLYRGLSLEAQKAQALSNLAGIALAQNDTRSARAAIEEALPIQRQFGDQQSLANSLHNLASGFLDEGKPEESRRAVEESLALRRQLRDRANAANSFYVCARLALQSQLHAEAVRWLSASEEAAAEFATPLFDRTRAVQREEIRRLRVLLPTATFDEEWRAGALLVHEWFGEAAGGAG
jgi:tetratricopeptide (TPR) repeat protein